MSNTRNIHIGKEKEKITQTSNHLKIITEKKGVHLSTNQGFYVIRKKREKKSYIGIVCARARACVCVCVTLSPLPSAHKAPRSSCGSALSLHRARSTHRETHGPVEKTTLL